MNPKVISKELPNMADFKKDEMRTLEKGRAKRKPKNIYCRRRGSENYILWRKKNIKSPKRPDPGQDTSDSSIDLLFIIVSSEIDLRLSESYS